MKTQFKNKKQSLVHALLGLLMLFAFNAKAQYCNPGNSHCCNYEYIQNVKFANINNTTGVSVSTGPTNYTAQTATVMPGNTYSISISSQPSGNYPQNYKVWIDWNQNLVFDPSEYYNIGFHNGVPFTITSNITVPGNALPGITRMRVTMYGNDIGDMTDPGGSNACASVWYGEIEDYSVFVQAFPCSGVVTPTISSASSTLCQGLPANITATGVTPSLGVAYEWQQATVSGGPYTSAGPTSTLFPTQIPAIATGTAYYVLVATCSGTASSTSNEISLAGAPVPTVPSVSASQSAACVGNTITLNAQSVAGTTYSWTGPNAFTSAVQTPTLNNAAAAATGVYSVVASKYNCKSNVGTFSITVSPNPTVNVLASQPQFCLGGPPLTLTATTNATTYSWSTGVNTQTASINPFATGFYIVDVQSAVGCTAQGVYTVVVVDATLSVTGAWSCNNGLGGSGVLTAQAFTPSTISWYANATSTNPISSVSSGTSGIGTFSINNSYGDSTVYVQAKFGVCPSQLMPVTLTVSPQPTVTVVSSPTLNTSLAPINVCSNDTYTLTALGASTYTWFNGQTTVVSNSLVFVPNTFTFVSNTNNFTVSAASSDGCTGDKKISLKVNPSPVVSAAAFTNNICPGGSVSLFAMGNANSYKWSANANNSTAPTIIVTPTQSAMYTVVGTAINGCTTAANQSITVNTPVTLTLTSQRPTMCAGETVSISAHGAVTYTWISNNFQLQGATVFISPELTTSYQVMATDANGCVSTATLSQIVSNCTGIQQISGNSGLTKVYPNPTNGEFTIELNNGAEKTVEMTDPAGRVVMSSTSGGNSAIINISELSNGVYYLKVRSNNAVEVIKVIKN